MTIDNVRRNDRAEKAIKHVGPYYPVDKMRRILAPEVTDPSIIERITDAYNEMSMMELRFIVGLIAACVFIAAAIVIL